MGGLKSIAFMALHLFPLLISVCRSNAQFPANSIIGDIACKIVDCGKGTCNGSAYDKPPFYFECMCDPGWTQVKIGDTTLPPCILPNCTLNSDCGFSQPPPPPPLLPPLIPAINISDPCNVTWCGDGTCKPTSGVLIPAPTCICNEGSFNLLNLSGLPCLKQCNIGADCPSLLLGPHPPPPVPSGGSAKGSDGCCSMNGGRCIVGSLVLMVLSMSLQLFI